MWDTARSVTRRQWQSRLCGRAYPAPALQCARGHLSLLEKQPPRSPCSLHSMSTAARKGPVFRGGSRGLLQKRHSNTTELGSCRGVGAPPAMSASSVGRSPQWNGRHRSTPHITALTIRETGPRRRGWAHPAQTARLPAVEGTVVARCGRTGCTETSLLPGPGGLCPDAPAGNSCK